MRDEHGKCVDGDLPSLSSLLWWLWRWCDENALKIMKISVFRFVVTAMWPSNWVEVWGETSWEVYFFCYENSWNYYIETYGRNCRIHKFNRKVSNLLPQKKNGSIRRKNVNVISVLWTPQSSSLLNTTTWNLKWLWFRNSSSSDDRNEIYFFSCKDKIMTDFDGKKMRFSFCVFPPKTSTIVFKHFFFLSNV